MDHAPPRRHQARGLVTRARLIEATAQVVADKGYAHATTRAIAEVAGVAESTIYRHFETKHDLFFAAVLDRHREVVEALADLPARAGTATVAANVSAIVHALAGMRADLLPLEQAIQSDPELRSHREALVAGALSGGPDGPDELVARYVAAEQHLGRVRGDVDPGAVAITLLITLAGVALLPTGDGSEAFDQVLDTAISLIVDGLTAGCG